jgi:hypothetical protein
MTHLESKYSETKLEMCTPWNTLKFQRCSSHCITGSDVSRLFYWQLQLKVTVTLHHPYLKGITTILVVSGISDVQGHGWDVISFLWAKNYPGSHCCDKCVSTMTLIPTVAIVCSKPWPQFPLLQYLLTMIPVPTVETCFNNYLGSHCCNNVHNDPRSWGLPSSQGGIWNTYRQGRAHNAFYSYATIWRTPNKTYSDNSNAENYLLFHVHF